MLKLLAAPMLALSLLALPGCATIGQGPRVTADQTLLDEQISIAVESSYQAAGQILLAQVRAGKISGVRLEQAEALEARAYLAVLAVRAAYDAGNREDYNTAFSDALRAIGAFRAVLKPESGS